MLSFQLKVSFTVILHDIGVKCNRKGRFYTFYTDLVQPRHCVKLTLHCSYKFYMNFTVWILCVRLTLYFTYMTYSSVSDASQTLLPLLMWTVGTPASWCITWSLYSYSPLYRTSFIKVLFVLAWHPFHRYLSIDVLVLVHLDINVLSLPFLLAVSFPISA